MMMNDPLSELARKIRSKKLNKEEIENLKKEAIESKIERNRRIKKAIEIQRIIRGYFARKKFKILEDKININTIIEYLYEKKVKRIHKHSSQIISYFIYKYIERQRKIKTQLIQEFKIHCSDVIKAFIRGVILRKKIKKQLEIIHNSKQKILPYIISFRTRLILKSRTIQNILIDIANMKFLLQDENEQNQSLQDKQTIKDLKLKLRKKYNEFYLIYYQFKMTYEWVDEERTINPWLKKYQQILNGEDVSFMKKEPEENNKQTKEKSQKKNYNENLLNKGNNNIINKFNEENNIDSNYNDEFDNNEINTEKYGSISQNNKIYREDERPIKPMKNNNFMNSQNPFGLSETGFPVDHSYNTNNSNNIKKNSPKKKIKRNKINNNANIYNNKNEEEKQIINQDNIDYNNINSNSNNNYISNNNKNYSSYDERPIGGNKIDYNAMFEDGNNFEQDGFGGANQQMNINNNKKKIIKKNSPRKKPVYDARKAIEEAKLREAKEGKKEKPSAFREFVKEMKKLSAKEKEGKINDNSSKLSHKSSKLNNQIKEDISIKTNNYIEENNDNNNNDENQESLNKEKRIPIHKRKPETKDMIMRKKLHQLEQSPPPMLNIKGIKSKIECWGPSNDTKKQKNNKNIFEKENKRITNINKKNNINLDSKDDINNLYSISKKESEMSNNNKNKEIDLKKIEEKMKKNALKKLNKIEDQIKRIDNEFNLDTYFKEKEKKMEEFGKIPYIKKEYNYVQRYSNDIYTRLARQLISMYQELK